MNAKQNNSDALLKKLLATQQDIRRILTDYKIKPGNITEMARQARSLISDSDLRANFLFLLIEFQDLGSRAKRHNVLDEAGITQQGELTGLASQATSRRHRKEGSEWETGDDSVLPDKLEDKPDTTRVDEGVSKGFFNSLD